MVIQGQHPRIVSPTLLMIKQNCIILTQFPSQLLMMQRSRQMEKLGQFGQTDGVIILMTPDTPGTTDTLFRVN